MRQFKLSIFIVAFLFVATQATAQEQDYRFHKVFFYSFTKYIEWPEEQKKGDFVIAVLGESEIIPLLKEMSEIKKVGDRKIKVVKIEEVKTTDYYHILFVPAARNGDFTASRKSLAGKPCLLVTETVDMARKGAMINFKEVQGKLRFEVNIQTVEASGLKMSSELTRFGEEVN